MKQSYIYKFIFLSVFFIGSYSIYAKTSSIPSYKNFKNIWELPVSDFFNCNPQVMLIDGTIRSTTFPYHNHNIASCENGQSFNFVATNNQMLFTIHNNESSHTIFASLYEIDNSDRMYINTYRIGDNHLFSNLIVGGEYQVVFFQQSATDQVSNVTYSATFDIPNMPFDNGPYLEVDTTTYSFSELVTDVLIDNECVQVSNITWATGNANDPSLAYFNGNGSVFPFEDGIVLTTGHASSVEGPRSTWAEYQDNGLPGDDDLMSILGVAGTLTNTARLEFDFVPVSNQISFNFIFASDEYGTFQCGYSDVFAFILTNLETGVSTNLAVVPNTTTPIAVTTIRDNAHNTSCASVNPEYFANFYPDGSTQAPINFRGHTVALTASSEVIPGTAYHIKLAIADYGPSVDWPDTSYDSAVFIEGGSFDIGSVDLGDDFLEENQTALCYNDTYLLESGLDPELFEIQWFLDDEPISGATEPNYLVEVDGVYKVEGVFIGTECAITDEIIVEMYPNIKTILNKPEDIEICSNTNDYVDLTQVEDGVLGEYNPSEFDFEYYLSLEDLENQINKVSNPVMYDTSEGTLIYMRIISTETECEDYFSFRIIIKADPIVTAFEDVMICNNFVLPEIQSNEKYFTGPNQTGVEYQPGHVLGIGTHKVYVLGEIDGCFGETSFTVDVIPCNIPNGISPNGDGLNDNLDLTYFRVANIEIYNRHGKVVYSHGLGYTNQWHGQDNSGGLLPDGTYFYKIYTVLDEFTGWIQINR